MAPQQPLTDFVALLDNPPDIVPRREELFHLRNGTVRLTPEEFDRYWPYMTNAWHKHSTHAKPATPTRPIETRIFWCRNGRADGRASTSSASRGIRRRTVEERPQCPVKMSIIVHYAVQPDQTIGAPVMYELLKKSGGEHKESLRSIDAKRRNEKVIEACTTHLLDNSNSPTHYVAKLWKEDDRFRAALEAAGGQDVGPDDAQNYVRQGHLSRKKSGAKKNSVSKSTSSSSSTMGTKLLDPQVLEGVRQLQTTVLIFSKSRPPSGDIVARRQALDLAFHHFNNLLPPLPALPPDPNTGMVPAIRERDLLTLSSHDGLYITLRFLEPPVPISQPPTPCMLYLHPGAMIASSNPVHLPVLSHLVHRTGVPALAVEYRLAPGYTPVNIHHVMGTPIPGAVQDAFDALTYLRQQAPNLSVDANRITVIGEGGGGAVAAALCHYALKRGVPIAKQILCSPMLDDRPGGVDLQPTTNGVDPSQSPNGAPPREKTSKLPQSLQLWTATDDATAWAAVLTPTSAIPSPAPIGPELVPGRMSEAPRGLPPVYIDVGEFDILRDECMQYAMKCWKAGVSCEMHVLPGCGTWFVEVAPGGKMAERAWEGRVRAICGV
ncbi:MAG: hypothetical protein Q9162_006051 [Coniocarpon cinnabarinum]